MTRGMSRRFRGYEACAAYPAPYPCPSWEVFYGSQAPNYRVFPVRS